MPFFSIVATSASATPPRLHSSMNAASCGFERAEMRGERMLRRHRDERDAHDGVRARREDAQQTLRGQIRRPRR